MNHSIDYYTTRNSDFRDFHSNKTKIVEEHRYEGRYSTPTYNRPYNSYQKPKEMKEIRQRELSEIHPKPKSISFGLCVECQRQLSGMKWCNSCNKAHFRFHHQISKWTSGEPILDDLIIGTQFTANNVHSFFEWIPFKDFDDVIYLAQGGHSKVYKAIWTRGPIIYWDVNTNSWERFGNHEVVLKVIRNSQKIFYEFINELTAHHKFNTIVGHVLRCFGISRWEDTGDFIVVTSYAKNGNLRQYISENHENLLWIDRLITLKDIAEGLKVIHSAGYVHRDLHPGNILRHGSWTMISDFGLTWNQDSVSPEGIFGLLPYIAPEILSSEYSPACDIYSFAMIMYEIASGKPPFYNQDINDISLLLCRPESPPGTPSCYTKIMESCWDPDPTSRPTADYLVRIFNDWILNYIICGNSFKRADLERKLNKTIDEKSMKTIDEACENFTHIDELCYSQMIFIPGVHDNFPYYYNLGKLS